MRRAGIAAVILIAVGASAPAGAADVHGWFVEMKRTAKDLRLAAAGGDSASISGARASAQGSATKAAMWPMGSVPQNVVEPCRDASNELLQAGQAAERGKAADYRDHMVRYGRLEDACFAAFSRAVRRS